MNITIYNTLSRQKEIFKPIEAGKVTMYHCGPTVYNVPHIGNYRTFLMNDIIRRVFEYNNYQVIQTMNVTDVDDKTLRGSQESGLPLLEFTRKYEELFLNELKSLNILLPTHVTRATEYINEMIAMISDLLAKDYAYVAKDGVYMSIDKIKDYGKLAQLDLTKISKERISNDDYNKENPRDFSLWKFKTSEDGDVSWQAPFGEGRPGWHIECSAMAIKTLGPSIDIHSGAIDLLFPHHTNEIAQSECLTGKTFVNYWIHGEFVNISNEKMAKSTGNFFKINDLTEQAVSPLAYRYWLLTAHYRSPVNFTYEAVQASQNALIKMIKIVMNYPKQGSIIPEYQEKFLSYINDDLNMPKALALAWELIGDSKQNEADKRSTLIDFDRVFGLKLDSLPEIENPEEIPVEIIALSEAREEARKAKDWAKADALRVEIGNRGFTVTDNKDGGVVLREI